MKLLDEGEFAEAAKKFEQLLEMLDSAGYVTFYLLLLIDLKNMKMFVV